MTGHGWHTVEVAVGPYRWTTLSSDTVKEAWEQYAGIGNLVPNPSFEVDTTSTATGQFLTLTRPAMGAFLNGHGGFLALVSVDGVNPPGGASGFLFGTPGGVNGISVTPGEVLSYSARVMRMNSTGPTTVRVLLLGYDAAGAFVSTFGNTTSSTLAGAPAAFQEGRLEGVTVPAGVAFVSLRLYRPAGDPGTTWTTGGLRIDAMQVVRGPVLPTTFLPGPRDPGVLLDGLKIAWEVADEDRHVYGQSKPWEADFRVLLPQLVDVDACAPGTPVAINVWANTPYETFPVPWESEQIPPLAMFRGRVADMVAIPAPRGLGNIVTLSCVDYTVDLVEVVVGLGAWPEEGAWQRLDNIGSTFGIPLLGSNSGVGGHWLEPRAAATITAYDALVKEILPGVAHRDDSRWGSQQVLTIGSGFGNYALDAPADPVDCWTIYRGYVATPESATDLVGPVVVAVPGRLGGPTTAVDIVIDAPTDRYTNMQTFHACKLERAVQWTRRRGHEVEAVVIERDGTLISTTWADGNPPTNPRAPVSTYTQETQTLYAAAHGDLTTYLAPESVESGWSLESVTLVDLDPAAEARRLFMMVPEGGGGGLSRTQPVVIHGLPPEHSPDGRDWYAGSLKGASIEFSGGRYAITAALTRRVARPEAFPWLVPAEDFDGYLSCDNLRDDPTYGATRHVDVVRTVTHYDLRIVRSHDA